MFAAPRIHDQPVTALYSNVIVMSDGTNEPFRWGNTSERPHRTGEGNRMAQQSNPDDWVKAASIRELGDAAEAQGITLAQLIDRITA